jgi:VWFA-related protein
MLNRSKLSLLALVALCAAGPRPVLADDKVLLDVVVRDKKGLPIRDLKPEEVEIVEAGSKREVQSLRLVEPGAAGAATDPQAKVPRYVTLVFDGFDLEGQKRARKAAAELVTKVLAPDVHVAVFRVGLELWALQGFTQDPKALQAAIERATSEADQTLTEDSEKAKIAASRELGAPETAARARLLIDVMRIGDQMQKMRQDQSQLYPLLALCKGQASAPGRKTLVYFSSGFTVPDRLDDVFKSVISEANRAGVALYVIDSVGVRSSGSMGSARDAMDEVAAIGKEASNAPQNPMSARTNLGVAEKVDAGSRDDVQRWMSQLAEGTSGFYLGNANDLRKATDRALSDMASYHELAYAPVSNATDGAYRSVEVKVTRPGVKVQGRAGYFALPADTGGALILAYEVPMLAALAATPPPKDFPIHAQAVRFGVAPDGRDHTLIVEVPLAGLKFDQDAAAKLYRLRFSLLVIVKNAAGEVVQRFSQNYPFEGPLDKLEALRRGNVVFKRSVRLPAGQYSFEAVVQDRATQAASAWKAPLEVPATTAGVQVGSLAVIRRVDPATPDPKGATDPFQIEGMRIVPNLDVDISKQTNDKLSFFLIVYPSPDAPAPTMTLEFSRDGKTVGRATPDLPAADKDGLIRYVGTFPLSSFPPGRYGVAIGIAQGRGRAEERAAFTVVP